jgi:hypothetical protein
MVDSSSTGRTDRFFSDNASCSSVEIALEIRLTFGTIAPTTRIFIEKDSRYFCAVTIAEKTRKPRHLQGVNDTC